jgi:DNA replication and repair protein RecF
MHLSFYQFKHYSNKTLEIQEALQVVVGNNGSGKSTLCEAVSILINASNSHHTSWEQKSSFGESEWALRLELGEILFQSIFDGKNRSPKWYMGEQSCSKPKYEDKMPCRAFWIQSDHLRVISGEPSERRNFLDEMLVFASPVYDKIQKNYRTALTSRNRVIQSILDKEATKSELSSWNTLLAEYAVQVIHERRKFFTWFQRQSLDHLDLPGPVRIELMERHPLEEVTKEHFLKLLTDYTERDLVVGRTTVGPHLDEISFSVEINNVWQATKYILSRGENKILLLAFIRLLGKYVEEISGKKPFFLLDDVLSELDTDHTHILCRLFEDTTTIMTTQPNHTGWLPNTFAKIEL